VSDFMSRASLAGAMDLSSLRKPEPTLAAQNSAPIVGEAIKVASLVMRGNQSNLKRLLEISNSVPVVIDFHTDRGDQSKALSPKLEALIKAQNGRILLVQIDIDAESQIAQAFQITQAPSVIAVLKGQPVPLFSGDQPNEALLTVFDRMLQVASENGLVGTVEVDENIVEEAPRLPRRHEAAYAAIDAGNYAEAISQYEAQLAESPADALAKSGLAQAKLLLRTDKIDFEAILASAPEDLAGVLLKADAFVAVGHPAQGFSVILTRFANSDPTDRELLRKHLIELFEVCPPDSPEVSAARRALASMLY
jgi:putative thioredoxin